jgi:pyruvate dehydrogenase E2 component (dihydrolipoamide acetyltransferase)
VSREFRLQDPGEGIHEAEIVEIDVSAGDRVEEGDTVLAVETDKATTELPSPYSGTVEAVAVAVGDLVRVGDLLMSFEGEDSERAHKEDKEPELEEEQAKDEEEPGEESAKATASPEQKDESQKAARAETREPGRREGPVPAAPSTRRLARELGVALDAVEPSGPGGRVLAEDVRAFAEEGDAARQEAEPAEAPRRKAPEAEPAEAPSEAYEMPDFSRWGEVERVPLRSIRRATAQEMARSWAEIPHVMHHDLADVTALERFRRDHADEVEQAGGKLTLTVLVMKALVGALRAFPRFNASLDPHDQAIVLKHYFHIGVAVATEHGLLVPVVRDADRKSLVELTAELVELAERARAGELQRQEMQGGSFTLTNVGGIGGTLFTPIIRHPEAAILGLGRAELRPVALGDADDPTLSARLLLPLCLAFDHRLNDGAEAARFTNRLIESLQDPESLLLAV